MSKCIYGHVLSEHHQQHSVLFLYFYPFRATESEQRYLESNVRVNLKRYLLLLLLPCDTGLPTEAPFLNRYNLSTVSNCSAWRSKKSRFSQARTPVCVKKQITVLMMSQPVSLVLRRLIILSISILPGHVAFFFFLSGEHLFGALPVCEECVSEQ